MPLKNREIVRSKDYSNLFQYFLSMCYDNLISHFSILQLREIVRSKDPELNKREHDNLISWTTPTCFSTFYRCAMVPTLLENSKVFRVLVKFSIIGFIPRTARFLLHARL